MAENELNTLVRHVTAHAARRYSPVNTELTALSNPRGVILRIYHVGLGTVDDEVGLPITVVVNVALTETWESKYTGKLTMALRHVEDVIADYDNIIGGLVTFEALPAWHPAAGPVTHTATHAPAEHALAAPAKAKRKAVRS